MIRRVMYALSCIALLATTASAQSQKTEHTLSLDPEASSPAATIDQVAWMAGTWRGEAFGGQVEEIWSEPIGNAMMGMFRMVQGKKAGFYELMTFKEESGSLIFRLKHFNADLTGWEEKDETVDFPLVATEGKIAFFDGITFMLVDDQTLNIYLASERKEGGFDELVFNYKRQ